MKKILIFLVLAFVAIKVGACAIIKDAKEYVERQIVSESVPEPTVEPETAKPVTSAAVSTDLPANVTTVTLIACIDGDTVLVQDGTREFKCRLIGVDTPESVAREEYLAKTGKENTAEGKDASNFAKALYEKEIGGKGGTLYVEYDVQAQDKYGRDLVYLYLPNGSMVQEILLENGMAQLMTIAPNVKHADRFLAVQQAARENKAGFWADGFFDDQTA